MLNSVPERYGIFFMELTTKTSRVWRLTSCSN